MIHKANGLAAALQADKTSKIFWQKVNNKNRSPSQLTLVSWVNGGSEGVRSKQTCSDIVKIWKDNNKGLLISDNSANESADFVEHSIDCMENYQRTEMTMCSVVSLVSLL